MNVLSMSMHCIAYGEETVKLSEHNSSKISANDGDKRDKPISLTAHLVYDISLRRSTNTVNSLKNSQSILHEVFSSHICNKNNMKTRRNEY